MRCADARDALTTALGAARGAECPPELAEHLAACPACRAEQQRSQALDRLLAAATRCEPSEAVVRSAARRGLARAARRPAAWPVNARLAWVAVALAAFALGFGVRGLTATRQSTAAQAPEVRERIVRVEVPVERERIVDRVVERIVRVPVVQTRVVIRYLPQRGSSPPDDRPVQPRMIVERLPSPPEPPQIRYSESISLARLANEEAQR